MLDGLKVNIVKLSEVGTLNENFRIDAEYFRKKYFDIESVITKNKSCRISELSPDILHPKEIKREYEDEGGVLFFRTQNLRPLRIDLSSQVFISSEDAQTLKNNVIRKNDVLITRTGANFGDTLVVINDFEAIASSHVFIFRNKVVNQTYLAVFLNTSYGREQINRGMYGGVQPEIAPYYLKNILIPTFSDDFQKEIEKIVKTAHAKLEQSKRLYAEAEKTLLEELGLKNWNSPTESISVKSFGKSFDKFGRLDAEYFHPQKDYAFRWLSKHSGEPIFTHFQSVREIYNPPTKDTGKLLQTFDLTHALNYFIEEGDVIPENEIGSTKKKIQYGDVVVSKLRSYLKEIAIVETEEESLGSSEFIVLRSYGKVTPELLMVYLRSQVVQTILQWSQDGSNHPRFQEEVLLSIKLPDKAIAAQKKIQKMIQAGVLANQESKRLLELSKRAVESAIEKGEKAGLRMLL